MDLINNLNLKELIVLAANAYAIYGAFKLQNKAAAIALIIGSVAPLNSAIKSGNTFSGEGQALAFGNINFYEVLSFGALGYGAYALYRSGLTSHAIAAGIAALFTILKGASNSETV